MKPQTYWKTWDEESSCVLLTSQEQRKKKIAIAIANYSRGKKGNWNSKWSRPLRRHCKNQYEFSLPGCSLLKSHHHHHQQSHRNLHHQDQQLIVAEVFDREEGIVMPTVWALSIVHWLLLLQNSCTVLPANQYQKCDSQFLLLHNYCHRPQAHTRCPTTTTTTLLYIPEKSYMGSRVSL